MEDSVIGARNAGRLEDGHPFASGEEPVLDAALSIVDAHMHLAEHLTAGPSYLVDAFQTDVEQSGHNVRASVFVECGARYRPSGPRHLRPVGETEFIARATNQSNSGRSRSVRVAAAIVGYVDLALGPKVVEVLDAHVDAGQGRFRGVRHRAKWDPDPRIQFSGGADRAEIYREPAVQHGLREVARRNLVFEASVFHPQISDVVALARAVPEASIVLDHAGSPLGRGTYRGRDSEVHDDWLAAMKELARCPNVSVKLGGLLMTLADAASTSGDTLTSSGIATAWRPYTEPCIELFGAQRCMVASNFPVDRAALAYSTVWNVFKQITSACSAEEKSALFSGTARRVYQIPQLQ